MQAIVSAHSRPAAATSSPIEGLPDELLSTVLIWHAFAHSPLYVDHHSKRPRRRYPFRWIYVLRVCRHWLQVALATPTLWHTIDVVKPKFSKWLNRVLSLIPQTVPLDILIASSDLTARVLPSITPRSAFIRSLHLPDDIPIALLKLDMPSLIELQAVDAEVSSMETPPSRKLAFLPQRFPSLRAIRMSRLMFTDIAIFKQLQVLYLRFCALGKKGPSTFDSLLDLLDECSQLEELRLYRILSKYLDNAPNVSPPTTRRPSRLKKLVLHDHPPHIAVFLSIYSFPETTTIRLSVWAHPSPQVDIVALFESLLPGDRTGLPILKAVNSASIKNFFTGTKLVGRVTQPDPSSSDRACPRITLKLPERLFPVNKVSGRLHHCTKAFARIFATAPLTTIDVMAHFWTMPRADWVELFTAFPDVRELRSNGAGAPTSLFHSLGRKPKYAQGQAPEDPPLAVLPKLETIELLNVDLEEGLLDAVASGLSNREDKQAPRLKYVGMLFGGLDMDPDDFEDEMEDVIADIKDLVDSFEYFFDD